MSTYMPLNAFEILLTCINIYSIHSIAYISLNPIDIIYIALWIENRLNIKKVMKKIVALTYIALNLSYFVQNATTCIDCINIIYIALWIENQLNIKKVMSKHCCIDCIDIDSIESIIFCTECHDLH